MLSANSAAATIRGQALALKPNGARSAVKLALACALATSGSLTCAAPPNREYTEAEPRYSSECTGEWRPRVKDLPCGAGTFLDYVMPSPDGYLDGIVRYIFPDGAVRTYHIYARRLCPAGTSMGSSGFCEGPLLNPAPPPKQQGVPQAGGCLAPWSAVGDPIVTATGNLFHQESDWGGGGLGALSLQRSYNSWSGRSAHQYGFGLASYHSPFGVGWSFTYGGAIFTNSMPPLHSVKVLRPDGRVLIFELRNGTWESDADVVERLGAHLDPSGRLAGWTLTTQDDGAETYDSQGRLLEITQRSGLRSRLAYGQAVTRNGPGRPGAPLEITDAFGRTIAFAYDDRGRILRATFPDGAIQRYAYDDEDRLTATTRPDATTRGYRYSEGRLGRLRGIGGASEDDIETFAYDETGRTTHAARQGGLDAVSLRYTAGATELTTALGATIRLGHTEVSGAERNRLVRTPCPGCENPDSALEVVYNANGYVSGYTDTPGDTSPAQNTRFAWDSSRNLLLTRTDAPGTSVARTSRATWHPSFRLPETITEGDLTTAYTYDDHGRVIGQVQTDAAHHLSRTITTRYDYASTVPGAVLQMVVTGPRTDLAQTTTTAFYAPDAACPGTAPLGCRGQVDTVTNALGQVTKVNAYNAAGQPLQITNPDGLVIHLGYDSRNRPTRLQVGAETTQYQYDAEGDLIQATRPDGSTVRYRYDVAHRLIGIALGDGSQIAYARDANGSVTQEQILDGRGKLTSTRRHVYDSLGRLIQDVGAVNQTTTQTHDAHGNVTAQSGPRTDVSDVTHYQYDLFNRLTQITQADGGLQQLAYDRLDHLTRVTDANNQVTQYTPDVWGDALQTVSSDSGTITRSFDAAGNLLTSTDALRQVTSYTYDALNRVLSKSSSVWGTPTYTFVYDTCPHGVGKLCMVEGDGMHMIAFTYDSQARLASRTDTIAGTAYTTGYTYHAGGTLASLRYPSGQTVHYAVDREGRVSQVSVQPAGGAAPFVLASLFTYHPFAGPASYTFGNGAAYVQTLDQDGQPTVRQSGPWVKSATYDPTGDLRTLTDADGTVQAYGYDAMGRLTAASDTASGSYGTRAYTYDLNGNRTSVTRNGATDPYSYNPPNWLAATRESKRTRNADGDLVDLSTLGTLQYDGYERLVAIQNRPPDGYAYNAFNARTYKDIHGQITRFVYGPNQELLVEQAAGGPEQDYVYLNGQLLARLDSTVGGAPTVYYVHTDALGTPRAMTDAAREIVWQASYAPFGLATVTQQSIVNNLRFPGQYLDPETQLAYNVHRYYDAAAGRYLQADPIGLAAGASLYAYVESNPLGFVDPYGLFGWADMPTLPQGLVDFSAGFGDSMSFGITGYARAGLAVGSVNNCSEHYRGGEFADLALETGTLGLSAGLKALAANASRAAARNGARPWIHRFRDARNLEGGFVHHSNPLFGHPGGIPATFPTGGLPSAVNSGAWNLRWFADSAGHGAAHRWMRGLENAWGGFVNPGAAAIRGTRDAADGCACQQ